ncbi:hypothetical protein N0V88_004223 [Collariella sp. IMI 366227]|nr:hypothetical protein N0V88_004223 [Collariella sp. IMI 366227]
MKRRELTMKLKGHPSKSSNDDKAKAPKWCIYLWDPENEDAPDIAEAVLGDSKRNSKWVSNRSALLPSLDANWIWPFRQFLTYDPHAAIPWEDAGEGVLTVNLAIWALAMMALNDGRRPIRTLRDTLPLGLW